MRRQRKLLLCGGLVLLLGTSFALPTTIYAHDGDPDKIHACVREANGRVRFVQPDNDCGQLNPPSAWTPIHWNIESSDDDWSGAGTGRLRPSTLSDSVSVGTESGSAKLHIQTDADDSNDAFQVDPQGRQGLLVDSQGNVIVGEPSGIPARLTVHAEENEDALRARIDDVTHFIVKADGQTGVGTSTPAARLEVNGRPDEDPFRVRTQGVTPDFIVNAEGNVGIGMPEPADKLSVLQEVEGRAGFFSIQNPSNVSAALSAITDGRGSAVFANVLNRASTSPALFARNSGSGPAAQFDRGDVRVLNGNVAIGTSDADRKLTVRDNNHQIAIVDSDNANKTWTLTSHQATSGVGIWENGNQGRLVVAAGGRVGIGTTNPQTKLHVNDGHMRVTNGDFARLRLTATDPATNVTMLIDARGDGTNRGQIGTTSNHDVIFITDNSTRMRMEADGDVCIGNGC